MLLEEEVAEELASMSEDDKKLLKRDALSDLYIFSKGIFGYQDINPETHGGFCQFIQSHPKKRRLGLMPRTHLKSTIATISDSGRLALIDPDEYRGLIAGETATTAQKFLSELTGQFRVNKVVRGLWPEYIPERFTGPGVNWSGDSATLVRNTAYGEATWTSIGVGGTKIGSHFSRIKCDDLIGLVAMRSPAKMAETVAWVNNIEPLLIDQHEDIIDWIGTRWSPFDLYAHVMELYGSEIAVFVREAVENGQIIFPAKHTWEEYNRLMTKTPLVWFAQYCNNPQATSGLDFNMEKVGVFKFSIDGGTLVFRCQLTGKEKTWNLDQLDVVITADPNSGSQLAPDMAAIIVSGISPDDEVFVLDTWSDRASPSAFVDKIFEKAQRWNPRVVGIEKAGQQNTEFYFKKKLEDTDVRFRVEPLSHKNVDKETRIRTALEPIVNSAQLYLLGSQQVLRGQLSQFPQNAQYDNALIDELDALAYGTLVFRKPMHQESQERRVKRVKFLLRHRMRSTGY